MQAVGVPGAAGPGVSYLSSLSEVHIHQHLDMLEGNVQMIAGNFVKPVFQFLMLSLKYTFIMCVPPFFSCVTLHSLLHGILLVYSRSTVTYKTIILITFKLLPDWFIFILYCLVCV